MSYISKAIFICAIVFFSSVKLFASTQQAPDFTKLYDKINPAVVNISTKLSRGPSPYGQFSDPLWNFIFPFKEPPRPEGYTPESLGTGFIIESDGLIVTNAHVIESAKSITVRLVDNTVYKAKVVGKDKSTDIALIKVQLKSKRKLVTAQLGSSQSTKVGEWVAAFGNPYGYSHTMTKGIISAKGREIDELNRFPFLQTDAGINKGNSGGPLVNLQGEVIGVNTAIHPGANGIGFAIPIDNVKTVLADLKKYGFVNRGFLGIYMVNLNLELARQLGLKNTKGALIIETLKGGPAQVAGIKPYDVVVKFDGKKIESVKQLINAVGSSPINKKIPMEIRRRGKQYSLKVTLVSRNQSRSKSSPFQSARRGGEHTVSAKFNLGFTMLEGSVAVAQKFNLPYLKGNQKPVVKRVRDGSPAAEGGLRSLDIILDVNLKSVSQVKDVNASLKKGNNFVRVLRGPNVYLLQLIVR